MLPLTFGLDQEHNISGTLLKTAGTQTWICVQMCIFKKTHTQKQVPYVPGKDE